jgi:hypothetical protein
MLLKEKNNMRMLIGFIFAALMAGCGTGEKPLTPEEIKQRDSVSRAEQRRTADSLRKTNPLLIVPPDSQYTGEYVDKYPSGIIKFKGIFRFGERHGVWISFFPSGLMWSEMHYEKGLRHGPNTTYYENGKKRYEGFYKNDLQDSVWVYFDTSGVEIERLLYKNNRVIKKLEAASSPTPSPGKK